MDIPFTVKARPDTGLWNAKIAIWLFLASEVMLFGGLFSAYIFLRVGSDTPWPSHVLKIPLGFTNTLILIFSSITVLQAWLSLKMRSYGRYVFYMSFTIGLALIFLCIKMYEYNDKFHHYGVRLQDHSILEGHLLEGYEIKFSDVKKITFQTRATETGLFSISLTNPGSDASFLKYLVGGGHPAATDKDGKEVLLDSSTVNQIVGDARSKGIGMIKSRAATEATLKDLDDNPDKKNNPKFQKALAFLTDANNQVKSDVVMVSKEPLKFAIPPGQLATWDGSKAVLKDGTVLEGRLEDDTMHLTAINVDLRQMIPDSEKNLTHAYAIVEKADAWRILGPEWLDAFEKHKEEFLRKHPNEKVVMANPDLTRDAFTMSLEGNEAGAASVQVPGKDASKAEAANPAEEHKASPAKKAGEEPEVAIAKKDISFYSNFTPKYHNYYALYFALTSLHGLHILGGIIVLGYFLLFGRKMYETNPEHLTNRVEVGGLFWHFVDVVWMILFPVLYLM